VQAIEQIQWPFRTGLDGLVPSPIFAAPRSEPIVSTDGAAAELQ
jgi:hypothetical protein